MKNTINKNSSIASITQYLIMISIIVGATLWISVNQTSTKVSVLHMQHTVSNLQEEIKHLERDLSSSNLFEKDDFDLLINRINKLESWTDSAPPDWFEGLFNEFRKTAHDEMLIFRKDINLMKNQFTLMKSIFMKHVDLHAQERLTLQREKSK